MFSNILGGLLIILGILFFFYPDSLRKRLRKKAIRKIRRYFFAAAFTLGILLISAGWKYPGLLPKLLAVGGIVAVLKSLFFLKAKAADQATEWILKQPVLFFKLFAVCQTVLGLLILFGLKS